MITRKAFKYLILLAAFAACAKSEAQDTGKNTGQLVKLTNVEVKTILPSDLDEFLTLTGYTEAIHDIIISSEQGGTVQELSVDRGGRVKKGQVLARVSADIYEPQLAQAEASLRLREAGLKKAVTLYDRGSITSMQRLEAQVNYDGARAQVDLARSKLDRAVIRAPVSGVIDDRYIDQGEMVAPGGQLFKLVDNRRMKIKSEFAELDVATFRPGISARIHLDAYPDTLFYAGLVFVASSAHQASRTYPCEFELDNSGGLILGGMHARIRILKNTHRSVVVLPQTALLETETGRSVFVLKGESASKRPVTIGASNNGMVVVESGLEVNETVIVSGQRELVDGQQVRVTARKD